MVSFSRPGQDGAPSPARPRTHTDLVCRSGFEPHTAPAMCDTERSVITSLSLSFSNQTQAFCGAEWSLKM